MVLQDVVRRWKETHSNFDQFAEKVAFQLNDTHPTIAVPELMRVLMDENQLGWSQAWDITSKVGPLPCFFCLLAAHFKAGKHYQCCSIEHANSAEILCRNTSSIHHDVVVKGCTEVQHGIFIQLGDARKDACHAISYQTLVAVKNLP